jgi:hypothetical protein
MQCLVRNTDDAYTSGLCRGFILNSGNLNDGKMARPKRFELLTPRFVVWAGPLKSLRSVTVRKPRLVEIDVIRTLLNGLRYRKK